LQTAFFLEKKGHILFRIPYTVFALRSSGKILPIGYRLSAGSPFARRSSEENGDAIFRIPYTVLRIPQGKLYTLWIGGDAETGHPNARSASEDVWGGEAAGPPDKSK